MKKSTLTYLPICKVIKFSLTQLVTKRPYYRFSHTKLMIGLSIFLLSTTPLFSFAASSMTELKVATFNVSMDATNYLPRGEIGTGVELVQSLNNNHQQIRNIAEIIQRTRPDIILLNEFDYIKDPKNGVELFIEQYLGESQQGATPIHYPYYYYAPVNTGVSTPFDLDNNGKTQGNLGDAHGFGHFPGHFGMVLLSRYPIEETNVRTFQHFLWKDMPNAAQPVDPTTNQPWYDDEEWDILRLSSKSHWDIPVKVNGKVVHILASHPTPPVFDGKEDRNGAKNHDEIRFWNDYITPKKSDYIYDDLGGTGGLEKNSRFIILGDQNASKDEGEARKEAIESLLTNPYTNNDITPTSISGSQNTNSTFAATHTAAWGMRADYVLPSRSGINIKEMGVFWPEKNTPLYRLVETRSASSDHRLVWANLLLVEKEQTVNNIIMVVGDGMGPAYTTAYRYYMDNLNSPLVEKTIFDNLLVGMASTYPVQSQGYITDSAAAATALATGHKTYNGAISVDTDKAHLLTLMELAKTLGKKTGLAVTSQINHATPAAYFSHNESRKNYNAIADSYFDDKIDGQFKADVMFGGGTQYFNRKDRNLVKEFTASGFQYIDQLSSLNTLNKEQPVLGLFAETGLPWTLDNRKNNHLLKLTQAAVKHLENESGYVLLVEASQIDWAGHSNDIASAMAEMDDLAKTLTWLKGYVDGRNDTLLVATADHSTGGLTLAAHGDYRWQPEYIKNLSASPETIAKQLVADDRAISAEKLTQLLGFTVSKQEAELFVKTTDKKSIYQQIKKLIDEKTNTGWTSTGHTGVDVQVFSTGIGAQKFTQHQTNTEIAEKLFTILKSN